MDSTSLPIGIFDSGVGGLTVAKEIYDLLPYENTIYLGDTARVPYGEKSANLIISYSVQITHFLISQKIKALVIACSTATAQSLNTLINTFPNLPIIGVIKPACQSALNISQNNRIGVIGTTGTINSQAFEKELFHHNPQISIFSKATPLFVDLIEQGITQGPILENTISTYLSEFNDQEIDTLILGCTHYPLISKAISNFLKPRVQLVNPGISTAENLKTLLMEKNLINHETLNANHQYFTTDTPDMFLKTANNFLGKSIHNNTSQIKL